MGKSTQKEQLLQLQALLMPILYRHVFTVKVALFVSICPHFHYCLRVLADGWTDASYEMHDLPATQSINISLCVNISG